MGRAAEDGGGPDRGCGRVRGEEGKHGRDGGGLEGFLANGEGDGGAFGRRRGKGVRRPSAFGGGVARRGCNSSKRGPGIALWRRASALGRVAEAPGRSLVPLKIFIKYNTY